MTAFRLLAYSWVVIIGLGYLLFSQRESVIHEVLMVNRVLAGIVLFGCIFLCFYEFGWRGGDKSKTSHM
jgi:hypothetical protein